MNDEHAVCCQGTSGKFRISSQDNAVLFQREADDIVVIERMVIENIESQQSHPLCELSQHDVGDELHCPTVKAIKKAKETVSRGACKERKEKRKPYSRTLQVLCELCKKKMTSYRLRKSSQP